METTTKQEIQRIVAQRDERICTTFKERASDMAKAGMGLTAVATQIAADEGLTPQRVLDILRREGLVGTASEFKAQAEGGEL